MTTLEEVLELHDVFDNESEVTAFWNNQPGYWADQDAGDVLDAFYEAYAGAWDSPADFAEQLAEDIGAIDWANLSWPMTCIDWDRAGRELLMGDYWESNGVYFRAL
jgi:hypothetical protein